MRYRHCCVLLVLLFAAPSLITGPTKRLIAHGSEFIPDAPFRFVLLNDSLEVPEQQDFEVIVEIQGQAIPQQVDLEVDGQKIPLVKKDAIRFTHRFRNVQEAIEFRFTAEGFNSETYTLKHHAGPALAGLQPGAWIIRATSAGRTRRSTTPATSRYRPAPGSRGT